MYRLILWIRSPGNTLWLMPSVGAAVAVIFAFAAAFIRYFLPENVLPDIDADTLQSLLDAISGSMLAVSTFSLSIMVSAFAAAASGATPRATELVMADDNTRLTIASFISAFIYAVIAKIALGLGYYGQNGRFILFVSTALVLAYVIVILIRWVGTLSQLGRLNNTVNKIEAAARDAYQQWINHPDFGANGQKPDTQSQGHIQATACGYLTHINMASLNRMAEDDCLHLHICQRPGKMLYTGDVLCEYYGDCPADRQEQYRDAFVIQDNRSYDQDPRYGLIVLSEVAQRALSPAVNDPGTAIKILNILGSLLTDTTPEADERDFPQLSIVAANYSDLIRQPFDPIARDGSGAYEIAGRIQKTLAAIARNNPLLAPACRQQAQRSAEYAANLPLEEDKNSILRLHTRLFPEAER